MRRSPKAAWLVVATVCVGAFMGQLDASIVTVAIPSMKTEFGVSLFEVEWVALIYLLILVGSISAIGRAADMFGRKLLYTYGFGLFTAASLVCALAPNIGWLLGARAVQAVGAAMLQANSVALIRTSVPRRQLGRAIGIQGAAQAVGLALGPSVGGLLVGLGGWRWVFFVNLPAGAIGLVLGWFLLPRTRVKAERGAFDWLGLLALMPGTAALLLALSQAARSGFADPRTLIPLAASAALLALFLLRERRAANPLVHLSLFSSASFSRGIGSGLLSYLVLFGILFVTPLYLEGAHGLHPAQAGLLLTVLPAALGLVAPAAGFAADRLGAAVPTAAGMTLTAAALVFLALRPGSLWTLGVVLAVMGIGVGLFTPANNAAVAASGPAHHAGMVSGLLNMTRGLGTSLGVALAAAAYALGSASSTPLEASQAGFRATALMLAAAAAVAALLSVGRRGTRRGRAPSNGPVRPDVGQGSAS